ncbi:MAG TPA: ketoacyl-ACP synthase III [Blastocatellia bacterium]|nr:ketoacyl-ACP synthase III [Blastocatellia bacterium]
MSCYITSVGAALPERIVTNAEIARILEVTPGWIEANSGIKERRWVSPDQAASNLAVKAMQDSLSSAGLSSDQIDYLIGCTLSPDYQMPGVAPIVQHKLAGCRSIPAVDIRSGCVGILYSFQLARSLVESGAAKLVGCFGTEAQSKGLNLSHNSAELSMLFGDGAGAMLVTNDIELSRKSGCCLRVDDILIGTDGSFAEDLAIKSPGTANGANWLDTEAIAAGKHFGSMNGRNVILQAVRKMSEAAIEIAERNNVALERIDLVIPHQANANLLKALCKKLSLPEDRVVINLDLFGNTSSAAAFLALWQAVRDERLKSGMTVMILAFGSGFTWGAALCKCI